MDINSLQIPKGSLSIDFSAPPTEIMPFISEVLDSANMTIFIYVNETLPKNDKWLRNYLSSARRQMQIKFVDYTLEIKHVPHDEFQQYINIDLDLEEKKIRTNAEKKISALLLECSRLHASDIHIDTLVDVSTIRVRVNRELFIWEKNSKETAKMLISVIYNTMCASAETSYNEFSSQDGVFKPQILPDGLSSIRVACGPSFHGPFLSLRLLYHENIDIQSDVNALEQLGYVPKQVSEFEILKIQPSGVVFVAGPTNSGKSTTLKEIMKDLASNPSKNVVSVEDPPEYPIPNVRQMPVVSRSDDDERTASFGRSIRLSLRTDPDVLMVGEIRDHSAADATLTYALSGHPVWTTIHADGTFGILDRLLSILVGPKYSERQAINLLSNPSIVRGLIFQRLVPVLCPSCSVPFGAVMRDGKIQGENIVHESGISISRLQHRLFEDAFRNECDVTNVDGSVNEKESKEKLNHLIGNIRLTRTNVINIKEYQDNNNQQSSHAEGNQEIKKYECPNKSCIKGVIGVKVIAEIVRTTSPLLEAVFSSSSVKAKQMWNRSNPTLTLQAIARSLIIKQQLDPIRAIETIGPLDADLL